MSTKKLDKNGQNRGGARVHNAGYKKLRIEVFDMLEQLIESNNNLSTLVKDKHDLLKKASLKVADMREQIRELENVCSEYEATEFILRDKIKHQDKTIMDLSEDVVHQAKKEIN